MKLKVLLIIALILVGALVLSIIQFTRALPKCNPYWPQSYSNLVIQPCPTPMVE